MANMNVQTTINTQAPTAYFNKTYYDKKLLETAKTQFVHANFGQKRNIPKGTGKTVEFRKYNLFTPSVTSNRLDEGVTPDAQTLSQTKVEATISQYGAYVVISDLLSMTAYDPVIDDTTELLGEQMGTLIDWITRDAMVAEASDQFAGGRASLSAVTASDKLTMTEVRKAVRTLKKNKARRFNTNVVDGSRRAPHFICICSPDATFDLQNDENWKDVSKYQNAEAIYSGEIGRMFGVVFVESTEAAISSQSVLNKVNADTSSSTTFVLKNTPTDKEALYLSVAGNKITIGSTEYTVASFDRSTKTVTLSASASLTADDIVYSKDCGAVDASTKAGIDVHHTMVFGADAYGTIDIDGSGAVETIIKPQGSEGAGDPLNQRSSVGAKINGYVAKVLNPLWIIDIQHAVSA